VRIAIIGTGISGLTAAHLLYRELHGRQQVEKGSSGRPGAARALAAPAGADAQEREAA
jgi:glycine/D-amino acid oxidase-like deaminating enzyme